ncbi:CDP-diacylglycerol--serine O-phosphatidyltransferase [Vulcanibacillus modesticaldus]|uniref:CDP-diacylglycerol--serine O-phosphatidyltransferase n=1 Tax=Vulcanibacillus modesticaldus TaxID=337097 RepID=A0A1D2YS04_9BACI|nr:CDP-diacylglycerol--serine O-phosphatidyltransferase [Vulcanibacillus modesticaldus]OEF96390.1 CDP-diacylglycerol--serine O-phosphatidyltransferase [Vulcanibacillus modesticaldus]
MIIRILPSMFTLGNLFLGIIAIILAFQGAVEYAAIMVIISMLLDGFDGRIARLLNVQSDFGKELDSLSDVISFGVAPAFIMYVVVLKDVGPLGWIVTALFPMAGALRLARFNVKPGIPGYFIGLPITAAGGVLATTTLYYEVFKVPVLVIIMTFLSYLMVSNIKYPNFKKVGFPKTVYFVVPLTLILVIVLAIYFPKGFPRVVFLPLGLYALYGIKKSFRRNKMNKHLADDEFRSELEKR